MRRYNVFVVLRRVRNSRTIIIIIVCVCWTQPWAVQKRLNDLVAVWGFDWGWTPWNQVLGRDPTAPQRRSNFWGQLPTYCKVPYGEYSACDRHSQTYSLGGSSDVTSHPANDRVLCFDEQGVSVTLCAGTSAGFWLGGQCPLAARGEENFENLTTKWCILKYIWKNVWSAWRRSLHLPTLIALKI